MRPHYRYIMRDQMKDRVTAIMAHELHGTCRAPLALSERPRWLMFLALAAAYTAAFTLSKDGFG